jgi:LPXTG-motif cell wall-anchored protein
MREVNRFALNFTQGASTTSTVNNTARTIDVTYTNYTSQIDIGLQTNTEGSAVSATAVVFTNTPPVIKNSAKVQNPETGDSSLPYSSMVAGMISLMVLAGIGVIARRKQES